MGLLLEQGQCCGRVERCTLLALLTRMSSWITSPEGKIQPQKKKTLMLTYIELRQLATAIQWELLPQ
jgi:hypothetical protein